MRPLVRELFIKKRVFHLEENRRRKSVRRYVRKAVYHKACIDVGRKPFAPKRVRPKKENRIHGSVCVALRETVRAEAYAGQRGEP